MKIVIIGATGKSGILLAEEALRKGHEVSAIVRDASKLTVKVSKVIEKDLFNLNYEDLKIYDVIIDAFGAWTPDTLILHQTSLKYLADILSGKPNRLLVVGSAGSLYVNPEHTVRLIDSPAMPEIYKPLSSNMCQALDALKVRTDVNWTYLSPSADFVPDGIRTGKYTLGDEELLVDANGESKISYADYAIAMIDEAENGRYIQKRFTVVSN